MRFPLCLAAAALLAGCSTVSAVRDAWNWDPTVAQQRPRVALSPEQLGTLTNRLADLQIRRNDIRARISAEPDVRARQGLYEELHGVGRQLSPLERELTAAGAR
ncbi:hypothetical protein ACFPOE_16445 [Caenimonas terrae]|uniref:Uncharacterized protein n=1 Tax=Caenimonas terrae TaxID=696074 RepID=A0ABW0NHQ0_9BURK